MRRLERLNPKRLIAALERGDRRGRRQNLDDGGGLKRRRRAIACKAPLQKRARAHGKGATVARDYRPVRQVAQPRSRQAFAPVLNPLAVERVVHRPHVARSARKRRDKDFRRLPAALEARAAASAVGSSRKKSSV